MLVSCHVHCFFLKRRKKFDGLRDEVFKMRLMVVDDDGLVCSFFL